MTCTAPLTRGPSEGLPATGTTAGFQRHRRAGERPCPLCSRANRDATRRARARVGSPPLGPGEQAAARGENGCRAAPPRPPGAG